MANKNHLNENKTPLYITGNSEILTKLSPKIFNIYKELAFERNIQSYEIIARPESGIGENSYGLVLQVCLQTPPTANEEIEKVTKTKAFVNILKISPKAPAFRSHARIVELYNREVFMYQHVFKEFKVLKQERFIELKKCLATANRNKDYSSFNVAPEMLYANLDLKDEFIILEDLTLSGYKQNLRTNMPTYDLVLEAFRSIAKMHAMSFILQYRKPKLFNNLVSKMTDNLFTTDMDPITEEFGKKYIRRTREMLQQEPKRSTRQLEVLKRLENNFKEVCLRCVDGNAAAPAVICHGDFWNNNILYKYDRQHQAISAKLIDFQICRYASPILDLVHYLFTCTEKDLRNKHFMEFMNIYHETLTHEIEYFGHPIDEMYPKGIFLKHLRDFGTYGFCMASLSIPFFISTASEWPDLEEVSHAIGEISSSENSDEEAEINEQDCGSNTTNKRLELLEEYDMLCERTLPIFRRRMFGIVRDLEKYQMTDNL